MDQKPTIVVLGFKQTYERDPATGLMNRPVDWVTYAPVHAVQTTQITERIDKMRPPERGLNRDDEGAKMAYLNIRWSMIERAYEAWKQGIEIPLEGTPLGVWPGINEAQANAFRAVGVKTIEGIAELPDNLIGKVALPGVREIKKQAGLFLAARDASTAATRQAEQEDRIRGLEEQLAAAMELLEEQEQSKKRGPGRPRKEDAEAEAA